MVKHKKIKYRSGLEKAFAEKTRGFAFEPIDIPYITRRKYKPDFVKDIYIIECKGFFRAGDTAKYKAIRDTIAEDGLELIFVLSDPTKKVRKGSKLNMGQWCEKEGIKHFTMKTVDKLQLYTNKQRD